MDARRALIISILAAAGLAGCSHHARDCQKACEVSFTCAGTVTVDGGVPTLCTYACETSDAQVKTSGCEATYEAQNACLAALDPKKCETIAMCAAEQDAFSKCTVDFCTKNPSSCE